MTNTKIYVVSDQEIFRTGVITLARKDPSLLIVGDSESLGKSRHAIKEISPDLIIVDLHGTGLDQNLLDLFHCNRSLVSKSIVITSASTDFEIAQCIQYGVGGIVCRNSTCDELISAVHRVISGRTFYCSLTAKRLKNHRGDQALTKRELEVLQFLALGLTNKEIAERLDIGVGTVKTHLINIHSKLNVATRTEAVIRGIQERLISL